MHTESIKRIVENTERMKVVKAMKCYKMKPEVFRATNDLITELMTAIIEDCHYIDYTTAVKLRKEAEEIYY